MRGIVTGERKGRVLYVDLVWLLKYALQYFSASAPRCIHAKFYIRGNLIGPVSVQRVPSVRIVAGTSVHAPYYVST
jgi:hypothetical protein